MKHEKDGMRKQHHKGGKHHDKMMKTLNLTDAQKTQMKANREEYKKQMQALKQDQNITVKEMNARKAALRQQQKTRMEALLTPDQKSKMAQAKLQREADAKQRSEKKLDKMMLKLGLSDDQVNRLRVQRESTHAQMKTIRENESLSPELKKQQMMALKNSAKEEHKRILTAEQLKKMEASKQHSKDKDRKRSKK